MERRFSDRETKGLDNKTCLEGNIFGNLVRDFLKENDLQLCSTHKGQLGYVLMGKEGSVGLILGQLGSGRFKLGSTGVMWGQG